MTDEEVKAIVAKYIISGHESDNADCLHEMDEWQTGEESEQDDLNKGYDFYRTAKVTVTWDDPEEGGVSEPAGDSPDSPAPGGARVPGGSDDYFPAKPAGDDTWPVLPGGYSAITISNVVLLSRNGHWYEVPEGTPAEDFLASLANSEA